jgi:FAD/FMN-containing dehydrogenase
LVPRDVGEACEFVRSAYQMRRVLVPCGHNTQAEFANHVDADAPRLLSTQLTAITEHDPASQVIAVQAGRSLASLQEALGQHGQWLPVRPPLADRRTIGGLVASGACGPERLRYGAPRDLLLGVKFVSGTGQLISGGGRVVKNVAGYDVTRLLVGSAGTLGFLVEATSRVLPLPQMCQCATGTGSLAQCHAAAAALLPSKLEPNLVVAVPNGSADWQLLAGFEGFADTVAAQVDGCAAILRQAGLGVQAVRPYAPLAGVCGDFFETLYDAPFVLRVDLPPDQVADFLATREGLLRGAGLLADFGCGRITAGLPTLGDAEWPAWCAAAHRAQGWVVLEKSPVAFRQQHDVFGSPRPDWPLMQRIKAALDPGDVFSACRLPGGRVPR